MRSTAKENKVCNHEGMLKSRMQELERQNRKLRTIIYWLSVKYRPKTKSECQNALL
jgi:hypothetical protein